MGNPDNQSLPAQRDAIIAQHGPWTSHNIRLAEGVYTIAPEPVGLEIQALRFLQLARDLTRKPFAEMRVLDLACLEGLYAIEFAAQGAQTLGIEIREANLAKAEFARNALGLGNCRFEQGDVRDLSLERHGQFDVVLCAGIFYHLDAPDVFRFLRAMSAVCTGVLLMDTHYAAAPQQSREFEGRTYHGEVYQEHDPASDAEQRRRILWASIDNQLSFWPTKASLFNMCLDSGFTSVSEVAMPPIYRRDRRFTIAAVKGAPVELRTTAPGLDLPALRYPEDTEWPEEADPTPESKSILRRVMARLRTNQ